MANLYVNLPVPAADGVGAWVATDQLGPEKTISVGGGAFSGLLYIEGTNDAQASTASVENKVRTSSDLYMTSQVLPINSPTQEPIKIAGVYQFMRVRRAVTGLGAGAPIVNIGGELDTTNIFAAMNVPPSGSVGTPTDLTLGGAVNTFSVSGPTQQRVTIEVSEDGVVFTPALVFDSGSGTTQSYFGTLKAARVRRDQVLDPVAVTRVSVGSGGAAGGGAPSGSGVLNFDSVNVVGTKLATFDTTGQEKGTIAFVGNDTFPDQNSVHDNYQLVYGENLTVPAFGLDVVNSPTFGVDGAQWKRMGVIDQQAIQKVFWSFDPQNVSGVANDENTGWGATEAAADLHPLLSMQALNRRLRGYSLDLPLLIHMMSAPNNATYETLTSLTTMTGTVNFVTFKGNLALVTPAGENRTVTAAQPAVPATNTERTITIGGFDDVSNFVGFMVRTVAGTKTAFVTRKIAPNVVAISEPRSSDELGGAGAVVDFAAEDQVSFFNPTSLCDWPFPDTGVPFPLLVWCRFDADGSGHYMGGKVGNFFPTIGQCILGDPTKLANSYNLVVNRNVYIETYSCQISGQHGNDISGGDWINYSLAVAVGGDGPQVHSSNWEFQDELNITATSGATPPAIDGGPAFRQLPGGPCNYFFGGDHLGTQIATWGATLSAGFDLWQPNHAPSGNFVVRSNNAGPNLFRWYGDTGGGIVGNLRLLTLGSNTSSQLPFSDRLTVLTAGQPPIMIDGAEFQFRDVPIFIPGSGAFLAGGQANGAGGPALNLGKELVGGGTCISYGIQSPALDAVPLTWTIGDRRYRVASGGPGGPSPLDAYWVCIASGTPGVWVLIRVPTVQLLWELNYRFNGVNPVVADALTNDAWTFVDQDVWLAQTGPDVRLIGESGALALNGTPIPEGVPGSTPDFIEVGVCLDLNLFTAPTVGGLQFTVVNQAGVTVATCDPINAGTTTGYVQAYYGPPAVAINPGDCLSLKLRTALAAGVGTLNTAIKVSGYRRTLV